MTTADENFTPDEFSLDGFELTPEWVKNPEKDFAEQPAERSSRGERRRPSGSRPPHRQDSRPSGRPPRKAYPAKRSAPSHRAGTPVLVAPIDVRFAPEETGFEAMIARLKQSLHAFPLFDLAKLILGKPQRYVVTLARKPGPDGQRAPFYFVPLSENPFLSRQDAVRHVMRRHLPQVACELKTAIEPPKGSFTFVNRCGFTGVWLGAPNHHEYQSNLVRHHQRRLRHVPFDQFKERIQTVRDEQAVKAWLDSMSVRTEYACALCAAPSTAEPAPAETEGERFATQQALEEHLVAVHLDQLVTELPEVTIGGAAVANLEQRSIVAAIRAAWETERRFPIATVNGLRPRLQKAGFHFFKHPDGVVYLNQTRLKRFELGQKLTLEIQRILDLLRQKGGCTSKQLMEHLLPERAPATEVQRAESGEPAQVVDPAEEPILADLRWLLTEGYAVELSDGRLWAPSEKMPLATPPPPATPTPESPAAESPATPAPSTDS